MLKAYLMENYGYNEPIFIKELSIDGLSQNAVRQSVKRLTAIGFLERYDNGIYYIPRFGGLLGKSYLDPTEVIMRNRESTNGRIITLGNQRVRVKSSPIIVSESNAELLQLLDSVGQAERYTELTIKETIDKLILYIRKKQFTKGQLSEVTSALTEATAKKMFEWGIIYEFA